MSGLVVTGETDHGWVANHGSAGEWTNGLKMVDGAVDAAEAFRRGDFIEGSVNGLSAGLDVVGAMLNPFGAAGSMVVGWLIEHIGPVQDFLDEMLGDPAAIRAGSQTWRNINEHLTGVAADYRSRAQGDTSGYTGLAIDAYRGYANLSADLMHEIARVASGVAGGIEVAGTLLAGVRDFIVGFVSDFVGEAIGAAAQSAVTLGIAAPAALASLANKARRLIQRARQLMDDLARSLDRMADLLGQISPALETATTTGAAMARHASRMREPELNLIVSMSKAFGGHDDRSTATA
ncbi:hypothetical protein [Nocardioides solisilvae]|uniref:hypothetical protein n=1 Tax=Nocardioides solisilvae TaxID=1542435 RepID=UPI000D744882|nr:hypothetical protein [Nocardioides solisilvae]